MSAVVWQLAPPGALAPSHPLFDLGTEAAVAHRDAWLEIAPGREPTGLASLGEALEAALSRRHACALVTLAVDAQDTPLAVHARWRFPTEPMARWLGAWLAEREAIWTLVPYPGDAMLHAQASGRLAWQVTQARGLPLRRVTCLARSLDLYPRHVDRRPDHDAVAMLVAAIADACEPSPLRLDVDGIRVTARTRDGGLGLRLPFHAPAAARDLPAAREAAWQHVAGAIHALAGAEPLRIAPWGWWDDRAAPTILLDLYGQRGPMLGNRFRRLPRTPPTSDHLDRTIAPWVATWELLAPTTFDGDPGPGDAWPEEPVLDVDGPSLRWATPTIAGASLAGPVVPMPGVPRGLEAIAEDLEPERLRGPSRWIARWHDGLLDADWVEQASPRAADARDTQCVAAVYEAFVLHAIEADAAAGPHWATPIEADDGRLGLALALSCADHGEGGGWDALWACLARLEGPFPWVTVGLAVGTLRVHLWYDQPRGDAPTWQPLGSAPLSPPDRPERP